MLRNVLVVTVSLVLATLLTVGVVYATAGDTFDWLAVNVGGVRVGASGQADADTVEFANDGLVKSESQLDLFVTDNSGDPLSGVSISLSAEGEDPPGVMIGAMEGNAMMGSLVSNEGEPNENLPVSMVLAEPAAEGEHSGQLLAGATDHNTKHAFVKATALPEGGEVNMFNDAGAEVRVDNSGDVVIVLGAP